MNEPIHIYVEIVIFNAVRVGLVQVHWDDNTLDHVGPFLKHVYDYFGILF